VIEFFCLTSIFKKRVAHFFVILPSCLFLFSCISQDINRSAVGSGRVSPPLSMVNFRVDGHCAVDIESNDFEEQVLIDRVRRLSLNLYDQDFIDLDCVYKFSDSKTVFHYFKSFDVLSNSAIRCDEVLRSEDHYRFLAESGVVIDGKKYSLPEFLYAFGLRAELCGDNRLAESAFLSAASLGYHLAALSAERVASYGEIR